MNKRIVEIFALTAAMAVGCHAAAIFDADFNSSAEGAVTGVSTLNDGTAIGSWSFQNAALGYAGGISTGADRAAAFAHNSGGITGMTMLDSAGVTYSGTYPETQTVDPTNVGVTKVIANFTAVGGFSGTDSTTINFDWGIFGTSNPGAFKHSYVRGLSSTGKEVFELLFVNGSGPASRTVYAREAGDDSTTLTAANAGTPEGTEIYNNLDADMNRTTMGGLPADLLGVSITLSNGQVTFGLERGTDAGNGLTFGINDGTATDIASLEFSEIWNTGIGGQNKGFWLDNVTVDAIPEPTTLGLVAGLGGALAFIRRKFMI